MNRRTGHRPVSGPTIITVSPTMMRAIHAQNTVRMPTSAEVRLFLMHNTLDLGLRRRDATARPLTAARSQGKARLQARCKVLRFR